MQKGGEDAEHLFPGSARAVEEVGPFGRHLVHQGDGAAFFRRRDVDRDSRAIPLRRDGPGEGDAFRRVKFEKAADMVDLVLAPPDLVGKFAADLWVVLDVEDFFFAKQRAEHETRYHVDVENGLVHALR